MKYSQLADTDLNVSKICLGTMTWGEQNSIDEAHQQLDYALERGVNFIDTAEMYPVPPKSKTAGKTEEFIGKWSKVKSHRDKFFIASKVAGPGLEHLNDGQSPFDLEHIEKAVDASLKRLNVDTIDLYQLHWPQRKTNFFGQLGLSQIDEQEQLTPIIERLLALQKLIEKGKIRYIGLSNETSWGAMKYLEQARAHGAPLIKTIQNPYNLLNRSYEVGLSEVSLRENIGLLSYSPLGFGTLTGKYLNDQKPSAARLTLYERFSRYTNPPSIRATERYFKLAKSNDLSLTHLALAFVNSQKFVTSNILGATSVDQLKENIDSIDVELSDDIIKAINEIHSEISNPAP